MNLGSVKLTDQQTGASITAELTGAPVPQSPGAGWNRVARPDRLSITEWGGREPVSLQLSLLVSSDADAEALQNFAGAGIDDSPPPILLLETEPARLLPFGPARAQGVSWFIDSGPSWDDEDLEIDDAGNWVQAFCEITVTQFVEDELTLTKSVPRKRRRKKKNKKKGGRHKGGKSRIYTVKAGDTLSSIAARELGSAKRWREIAKLNRLSDPKDIKVGQRLKMP